MKLFIPIIGSISAGKSTFLKGFLGINELETGANVTTKFVCLIQNSLQTSFYHVILSKQNDNVILTKDGAEIKDLPKIKNKIEELNKKYAGAQANRNELFYMLETPIKNINNKDLLDNCIFMDIPGLNEVNKDYISEIFSIINMKNILFEILIFDATSFYSDKKLNIILELDKKKCLQKTGNLYILNKIDNFCNTTPGGEKNTIENFKLDFYQNFDKNSQNTVFLNIYNNYFVPMNSILYNAESRFEEDFCSWLTVELFYYLESFNQEVSSFFEYLEKRLSNILLQNEIKEDFIEKAYDSVTEGDMKKIEDSIDTLQDILTQTLKNENFVFGIKLEKSKIKKVMKKLYIIHKKKMIGNLFHSSFYEELQEIIKNMKANKEYNLPSPPPINQTKIIEKKYKEDDILKEMKEFLKEKLENQFEELNSNLLAIEENLFGRKIRVAFIGPISVGKSTVLNCIIGEKILPTKMEECTYRGIIIKHEPNFKDFYLYKVRAKVINEGCGLLEFTNYIEETDPYCKGIKNIESFLTTNNNIKKIETDSEAFIVIKGKLKIFDYIKLEQEILNKIEFVDLPGFDREKNEFNEKQYYHKILKFSNSCIYINTASNIRAKESFERMKTQYDGDKENIFSLLKPRFIDTCLFLINKVDELPKDKDKQQAKNDLIEIITKIEPLVKNNRNRINISFFSGTYFFQYLKDYERYATNLEKNPFLTLSELFNEWSSSRYFLYFFNFKKYIVDKISDKIEDKYDEIEEKQVPQQFYNNLKAAFNQLYNRKYRSISSDDEDQIIKTLYNIHILFKNKKFSNPNYSSMFFDDLKRMIINSEDLQKENFYKNFEAFFQSADELFKRQIKKETEILKKKGKYSYNFFIKELIPDTEKVLTEKENIIKEIINSGKQNCLNEFDYEIRNAGQILYEKNYDVERAFSDLKKRIEEKINSMQKEQEKIVNNLIEDIKNRAKEKIKAHYQSQNLPVNEIDIQIEGTYVLFNEILVISLAIIGKILGTAAGFGFLAGIGIGIEIALGTSITIGLGIIVFLGLLGGVAVGGIVETVRFFWSRYKKMKQYKEALKNSKEKLINKFKEVEYSFSDHFKTFKDTLIKELRLKTEIYLKRINNDEAEWKKIQEQYETIKVNTKKRFEEKFRLNEDFKFNK